VAIAFNEFANGAAQASVRLKDGRIFENVLVSNGSAIIAIRGYDEPPFKSEEIEQIFQAESDKNPQVRNGWTFWDEWRRTLPLNIALNLWIERGTSRLMRYVTWLATVPLCINPTDGKSV
jgi:hypothetical protein